MRAFVVPVLLLISLPVGAQNLPDIVVWDDFETGDTRFWTTTVPPLPFTVCTPPTGAVKLTVPTVLGDGTPGSVEGPDIQAALDAGGHITFDVGSDPVTITLISELVVTRDAVLDGAGVVTLSGGGIIRVLRVVPPSTGSYRLTLQHLIVANGSVTGGTFPQDSGAGLLLQGGGAWQSVDLVLVDCIFRDNVAVVSGQDSGGGAIYAVGPNAFWLVGCSFRRNLGSNGGAIYALQAVDMVFTGCDVLDNRATGSGGNPGNGGNGGGIGIDGVFWSFSACDITVTGNRANAFGGGLFAVDNYAEGTFELIASTIESNQSTGANEHSGGVYVQGAEILIGDSTFRSNTARAFAGLFVGPDTRGDIRNCTFTENVATDGLGGAMAFSTSDPILIDHCTIVDNHAPCDVCFGGGITVGGAPLTLRNSVLADNTGGNQWVSWNITETVSDGGGVIQWPAQRPNGTDEIPATAGVTWAEPLLAPINAYGGVTETMGLLPGSPAIGHAGPAVSPADQRGRARTVPTDAGAFETP